MSGGQIGFGLALTALSWVAAYFTTRWPRRPPLGQFRESPMFQPKGRGTAAVIATLFAAFTALLFFAGRL
jgi:hypothetical protein